MPYGRRLAWSYSLVALLCSLGCDDSESINPVNNGTSGSAGAAGSGATGGSSGGAGSSNAQIPDNISLHSDSASLNITTSPFSFDLQNANGDSLLKTVPPTEVEDANNAYGPLGATHKYVIIRTPVVEGWDHQTITDNPWLQATKVTAADYSDTKATLKLTDPDDETLEVTLTFEITGTQVDIDAQASGGKPTGDEDDAAAKGINAMGIAFELPEDEHFYGLGERYVTSDHRGQHYQSWTEEGGVGAGESKPAGPNNPSPNGPSMTHAPIPFFISNRGYSLWQNTSYRTGFVLGQEDSSLWRLYSSEPALHLKVFVHDNPLDSIEHFTKIVGRASLPAPWVFGPRRRVNSGDVIDGVSEIQAMRDRGVPVTVVDDAAHFLPIGSQVGREDELLAWTKALHDLGYKADAYYNAYVSVTDDRTIELVAYAREHDYFVKLEDGSEFNTFMVSSGGQTVATIDMTNPDAVEWYQSLLQQALDLGYDGWMLDFGEYLPPNAKMFDGRTGWEAHNAFPIDYQKATFDYMTKVRGNDFMFFARAGYTGTQKYAPVTWSGDPAASFDDVKGLPAQVRAGISAGVSGIAFWGSDIGGYTCLIDPPADKEVLLRWVEFGALSSDMHDEDACAQKPADAPEKATLWDDEESTQTWGKYALLHTRLFPYLYVAAKEATERGTPVMRHPMLIHPKEQGALQSEFDYYFGPSLYVAPVVRRGQTTRTVWLPPVRFVDWWTYDEIEGGTTIEYDAPLGTLPLFLRSGGIVPLLDDSIQTLVEDYSDTVVGLNDVKAWLDVRAAIDSATASGEITLVDGTQLSMTMTNATVALPDGLAAAMSDAELKTCTSCGVIDTLPSGAKRVRVSVSAQQSPSVNLGGVTLKQSNSEAVIRWDIVVLP